MMEAWRIKQRWWIQSVNFWDAGVEMCWRMNGGGGGKLWCVILLLRGDLALLCFRMREMWMYLWADEMEPAEWERSVPKTLLQNHWKDHQSCLKQRENIRGLCTVAEVWSHFTCFSAVSHQPPHPGIPTVPNSTVKCERHIGIFLLWQNCLLMNWVWMNQMQMEWVSLKINMNYKTGRGKMPKEKSLCQMKIAWNVIIIIIFTLAQSSHPSLCHPLTCSQFVCRDDIFSPLGTLGTRPGKPRRQGTDGKQWYKMCIGIFQSARGLWGCWWEMILACFKDVLPS